MAFKPSPVAFAASASSLLPPKLDFCGSVTKLRPPTALNQSRRGSKARIVALGAAPTPPPPSEENQNQKETPEVEVEASTQSGPAAQSEPAEEIAADDILNSPSFLKKKLEIVQKELIDAQGAAEQSSEAVKEEKAKYVRLAADFENYRRRSMEDLRKQDNKSTAKVCKEILGVLDNFERAIAAVKPETDREKSISSSYQAINKQLLDSLTKLKVEPVDAIGEVFDPSFHEAIQKMESDSYKEDVVCQQFQRGYRLGDVLIRAAIVAVSTGPGPLEDDSNGGEDLVAEDTDEIEQPV
ncbi:HSP GrpE [Gracilaria domingensis]|nr:HSP GrpE [Gracilaria domingensis]